MIAALIIMAQTEMVLRREQEARWREEFFKADAETQKKMLEKKEKDRLEEIEERRHREQIRAQERIADAIRSSSFWRF